MKKKLLPVLIAGTLLLGGLIVVNGDPKEPPLPPITPSSVTTQINS